MVKDRRRSGQSIDEGTSDQTSVPGKIDSLKGAAAKKDDVVTAGKHIPGSNRDPLIPLGNCEQASDADEAAVAGRANIPHDRDNRSENLRIDTPETRSIQSVRLKRAADEKADTPFEIHLHQGVSENAEKPK